MLLEVYVNRSGCHVCPIFCQHFIRNNIANKNKRNAMFFVDEPYEKIKT